VKEARGGAPALTGSAPLAPADRREPPGPDAEVQVTWRKRVTKHSLGPQASRFSASGAGPGSGLDMESDYHRGFSGSVVLWFSGFLVSGSFVSGSLVSGSLVSASWFSGSRYRTLLFISVGKFFSAFDPPSGIKEQWAAVKQLGGGFKEPEIPRPADPQNPDLQTP